MSPEETAGSVEMALGMWGAVATVGLQRGMDLWGDDAVFCQITLTSCYAIVYFLLRHDRGADCDHVD